MKAEEQRKQSDIQNQPLSGYEPPRMISYSEEELIEEMEGMAIQACSGFTSIAGC